MTTLIVEDGTLQDGKQQSPWTTELANTYVTEQEFRDYYTSRNDPTAAEADAEVICAALLFAWDYMQQNWRHRWRGSRSAAYQSGDWPRRGVSIEDFFDPFDDRIPQRISLDFRDTLFIPENVVPQEVKDSQIMLARHSVQDATTQESLLGELGRVTKREKLGDLEVEYFGTDSGQENRTESIYADALRRVQIYMKPTSTGVAIRA